MHIINDILDFSKLEAGKLKLEKISFNPMLLLNEVYQLFKPLADAKNLLLLLTIDKDLPGMLYGDPFRLKQILFNLLSNAVKFTRNGSIEFIIKTEPKNKKSIDLIVTIKDTGIGIPENKLENVFEEFTQAEMNTTRQYGGTGLGLSIVKKLISLQNGKIELKSKQGEGSSFTFIIPFDICYDQPTEEIKKDLFQIYPELNEISILIADDDEYNKMLIGHILDKQKSNYKQVNNGKELIDELILRSYDIILMDIRMPVMDGLQTTKHIRNNMKPPFSEIPVIALTATLTSEEVIKYRGLGMNAVISKPFSENQLLQTMSDVLHNISQKEMTANKVFVSNGEERNIPETELPVKLAKLYNLAGNDKKFVKEMLDMFVRTTQQGVSDMCLKSTEKDWEGVAELAHKIVAPCKHVGADELVVFLKRIEELARDGKDENLLSDLINKAQSNSTTVIMYIQNHLEQEI